MHVAQPASTAAFTHPNPLVLHVHSHRGTSMRNIDGKRGKQSGRKSQEGRRCHREKQGSVSLLSVSARGKRRSTAVAGAYLSVASCSRHHTWQVACWSGPCWAAMPACLICTGSSRKDSSGERRRRGADVHAGQVLPHGASSQAAGLAAREVPLFSSSSSPATCRPAPLLGLALAGAQAAARAAARQRPQLGIQLGSWHVA